VDFSGLFHRFIELPEESPLVRLGRRPLNGLFPCFFALRILGFLRPRQASFVDFPSGHLTNYPRPPSVVPIRTRPSSTTALSL